MTIKASSQITISKVIDIYACYRYYKLQGSTLAKPTKPTKNPPNGWSDTEPAYISGSTNTLYFVDCNVYSDKTFSFSEVSKSSSYEAAKDAWNKANNAQNSVDNMEIGGRNLVLNSRGNSKTGFFANFSKATDEYAEVTISSKKNYSGIYLTAGYLLGCRDYEVDKVYVFSYDIMFTVWDFPTGTNRHEWWIGQRYTNTPSGETGTGQWTGVTTTPMPVVGMDGCELNKWFHVENKITIPKQASSNVSTEAKISLYNSYADATAKVTFRMKNVKLEKGNKATDWTPAPEDGIAKVDVEYYLSTSATSLAGGSWTTTAPTWVNGKYMWSRTVMIDGAGNKTYSPNQNGVCIAGAKGNTGAQGPKGDTGAQGPKGDKGNTGDTGATGATGNGIKSIVEQYYQSTSATSLAGGSWTNTYPGWVNSKYIWTRSVITYTSGSTATTTPICVTGQKGDTGPKGDKGNTGAQGPQGAAGKSIGSVVNYYLATNASSGVTTSATGWTTNVQSVTATNKYLWNYEVIKYTDGSVASTTTPCIIGAYGDKGATGPKGDKGTTGATGATGATGKGIKSVTEHYAVSASNSTAPTSWSTTVPTMTSTNRYLWNYETIAYTDNSTSDTTKRVIGVYGDKGNTGPQGVKGDKGNTGPQGPKGDKGDKGNTGATGAAGKGVKSTAITYQASTSGVVTPTGTWSTTIPAVSAGSYLWTRTIITYTDNNTSTSYSVGKMGNTGAQGPKGDTGAQGPKGDKGNTGATGAAGKGIKSTAVTYQAGMTGVAVPTGTWSTTIPSTSASKPYLWSRTIITYTDNTTSTTYSVGSTADSVQVGGRNLIIDSDKLSKWICTGINGYDAEVKEYNTTKYPSGKYTECKCTKAGTGLYISAGCYNNTNKIMKGDTVTLSGWVYCSVDKGLLSPTIEFASNITWKVRPKLCTTWSYFECTIVSRTDIPTATGGVAICFYNTFAVNEVIAFSSFKLEKGNKATDWTPAPEDLIKSITEANTAIEKTDEKISMKASVDSVTEISNRANEIEGMLSEAKTTIARHEESIQLLTSDEFTVKFTNVVQQITSVDGKFEQYKEKMDNWLRFDKNGNLIIGSTRVPGQPAYEIMIGKNRISFLLNDIEVAYISDDEMHINKSTVMESITIGRENQKFIWEMRGNGNLGLVWR